MKMMGTFRLCTVSLLWLIVVVNSICDPRSVWGPEQQNRMCKLWLCIVSVFGLIVAVKSGCEPSPTGCIRNNNDYANDTEVYPIAVLNCSFDGSLCCYRQGCVDDEMERWKANSGYASVRQNSTGCGARVYSILESPWVNFSTSSCVEFTYSRGTPYELYVFLNFNNGTPPSLKYNSTGDVFNKTYTSCFDVKSLTGKIQFRAKGGGGQAPSIPLPKLYYVRILEGPCANLDQTTSESIQTSTSGNASSEHSDEVSDPTTCDLVTTTPPGTENTTSDATTNLTSPPSDTSTSGQPTATSGSWSSASSSSSPSSPHELFASTSSSSPQYSEGSTEESSADGGSGKNVAVIVGALVAAVVVFVIIVIVCRRKFQKRRGSGSDGARQLAVYENQGFHGQPVGTPVDDSSVVNAQDMSDHRDPSRASDASNEYLTPMNVYDGLGNRNIEENPYNALANQNSTYEGLSPNRNETRLYDSLVASGGQSEDYEIPDTTGLNKETEVNRDSDEYYNQASSKMTGNSSLSQDVPSSKVSEYQNG